MSESSDSAFPAERADVDVERLHAPIIREKSEPADGYEPISISLMFLFFALIMWGGWYIGHYNGGWAGDILDEGPSMTPNRGAAAAAPAEEIPLAQLGETVYSNCRSCHQANGKGTSLYPPLAGSEWLTGDPEAPIRIVLDGLKGPVEVAGKTYNSEMPPWRNILDDKRIAAVLTYARQSWGNDAPEVKPEEVAAVREATASRKGRYTAEELGKP